MLRAPFGNGPCDLKQRARVPTRKGRRNQALGATPPRSELCRSPCLVLPFGPSRLQRRTESLHLQARSRRRTLANPPTLETPCRRGEPATRSSWGEKRRPFPFGQTLEHRPLLSLFSFSSQDDPIDQVVSRQSQPFRNGPIPGGDSEARGDRRLEGGQNREAVGGARPTSPAK